MNCESWLDPKNSLITAVIGFMLMSACGVITSRSWMVIRSLMTRSIRWNPTLIWFMMSSPTERTLRFPRWSMSSTTVGMNRFFVFARGSGSSISYPSASAIKYRKYFNE